MKRWKPYASLLLALMMCLSLAACGGGGDVSDEGDVSMDGEISIEDLEGFWYPAEGIGETTSVLICIYIDGTAGTWEEYDEYGELTGYSGDAYTDGIVLTLTDVPLIGDVEIPIGDADTLVTDTGEIYWIKGDPGFGAAPEPTAFYGNWYLRGDHESEYATVLTLNEDGTYTRGDMEEGTYTYEEFDEYGQDSDTPVFRQEITLSGGVNEMYYLVSDGQVLVRWSDASNGEDYYIREEALDNTSLSTEYNLTNESFSGDGYYLTFNREVYTVVCDFYGEGTRTGTWEVDGTTVLIFWDDGETDEAELDWKTLYLSSTGETLENPW